MNPYPRKPLRLILWLILLLILLLVTFLLDRFDQTDQHEPVPMSPQNSVNYNGYPSQKLALNQFIGQYFLTQGLMVTNLKETNQGKLASGQDLLSESVGLMLLYYIESDQEEAFVNHYELAVSLLKKKNGLFQWRTRVEQPVTVNASVDDLRIAKALLLASEKWHREDFKDSALELSTALLTHCTKNDVLLSFDDATAPEADPYYYDFKAMLMLAESHPQWQAILTNSFNRIRASRLPIHPFYITASRTTGSYLTTENTLVILHMVEIGQVNQNDIRWLKLQLKRGSLYASYNANGKPTSSIESPAIYGIVAQIGKTTADEELYRLACTKLKSMQNLKTGNTYGGFLSTNQQDAYSFDHLMALLGY